MITDDKVIAIYCLADDFCKFFSAEVKRYQLEVPKTTRRYHRSSRLSDAEVITILVLFHLKGYRCLKHFYVDYVCKHMRDIFPMGVSEIAAKAGFVNSSHFGRLFRGITEYTPGQWRKSRT